jgi:histidinol phosphatase-like PHP family hydrolase
MSNSVNWSNPYADRNGQWYKGNLHAHTSPASGCGTLRVEDVWNRYARAGYDFLALSDHMNFSVFQDERMVWIPGLEWNSTTGEHTGVYSLDQPLVRRCIEIADQGELLAFLADKEALVVLNHPNWQLTPHYRREQLEARRGYDGIEVYNQVIERLDGYAISSDKWDYLLVKNRRVLALASDDSHNAADIGNAFLAVRARERSAKAILDGLRAGNFYCSSGQSVIDVRREGGTIVIETPDAQEIQAVGAGGVRFERVKTPCMSFDLAHAFGPYVRFQAFGQGSEMAWTQPFFV